MLDKVIYHEDKPPDIAEISTRETKERINAFLIKYSGGEVQTGPFKGMKLLPDQSWEDFNIGTLILGCYEQELHQPVEDEIKRLSAKPTSKIVNIGCAEGYYSVGFAMRIPTAKVWAIDVNEQALKNTMANAELNGVADRIVVFGNLNEAFSNPDLVFSDCEGAETAYLDMQRFPTLLQARLIVEIHDTEDNPAFFTLCERFKYTHNVYFINEGPRNPNDFEFMRSWHSTARWMAVSEGRPCMMRYLYCVPKPSQEP